MYAATIKTKKITKEEIMAICPFQFVVVNERNNKLCIDVCLATKEQLQELETTFTGMEFKYVGIWKHDGKKYGSEQDEQDSLKDITLDETEYLDIVPDIIVDEVAQRPTVATQVHGFFGWEDKII